AGGVVLQDEPEITFTAADPVEIVIPTGSQPGASIAGEIITNSPTVRLTDEYNNLVPGINVTVTEQSGQIFASGTETVSTNSSGLAVFDDLVITDAGQYNLVFTAETLTVTSNAFEVSAADPDPSETTASVPSGSAGDATNISITVQDAFGNRVEGVSGLLNASVTSGPNSGAEFTAISESGNGIYTTSYTPTTTGDDEITITLDGTGIQGSPFTSNVSTSDAADITVNQQPLETVAGQPIEGPPSVLVEDDLQNPVQGVEVTVSEEGGYTFDSGTTTVSTDVNGIASFNDLAINQSGNFTLVFDAVGVDDNADSNPFDVIPSSVNAGVSSASVNPSTLTVGENSTLTIQVRDEFNNEIEGLTIDDFTINLSGDAVTTETFEETSAGTYQTDVTNNTDETVTVTVTVDGVQLDDEPSIIFEAGDPASLTITQHPASTTAGEDINPA
ncbi:MAG: hypothetical protein LC650_03265, partial [Actinobacteria bacterium]|nr:hypothetical protein [Actinomycetota bacterium]